MTDDKALRIWLFIAFLVMALCATGIFYESYLDKQEREQELELAWKQLKPGIAPWMWWDIVGHTVVEHYFIDGGLHLTDSTTAGITVYDNTWIELPDPFVEQEWINPGSQTGLTGAKEKISSEWVGSLVICIMNGYDAGGFLVARGIAIDELKKIGIEVE